MAKGKDALGVGKKHKGLKRCLDDTAELCKKGMAKERGSAEGEESPASGKEQQAMMMAEPQTSSYKDVIRRLPAGAQPAADFLSSGRRSYTIPPSSGSGRPIQVLPETRLSAG